MKIAPAKKRLFAYAGIIGAFALCGVIFFTISQYQRAKYSSSKAQLDSATTELKKLDDEEAQVNEDTELSEIEKTVKLRVIEDKRVWYTKIQTHFNEENTKNAKAYKATSIPAYSCSLLALVSFGFCLKFEDKVREKEENAQ